MNGLSRRLIVPLAAGTAVAVVVAWFPFSTLLAQSAQLDSAQAQLNSLRHESRQLAAEAKGLSSQASAIRLAREEYQLVLPGQRLLEILGPGAPRGATSGDPGLQPLARPSTTDGGLLGSPSDPAATSTARPGLWSRVVRTLEFWR